jgi:exosortase/archaeosortase family protein
MCVAYVVIALGASLLLLSDLVFDDLLAGLRLAVARASAGVLGAFGMPVTTSGTTIHGPGTPLVIVNECTGIDATILLGAAILVFPATWRQRLAGLALASVVMMGVNFVRVLSLVWIGNYSPGFLDIGHLYVWPVLVILVGVGTLLLWADRIGPRPA